MNKLNEEIIRRVTADESRNKIIGLEIKNQRTKLQKTQEDVAGKIVSISYLCKIEKNSINPNIKSLSRICENVDITRDKLQLIIDLRESVKTTINALYWEKGQLIEKIYKETEFMDNFRARIIKMAYYIYIKDYHMVRETIKFLDGLIGTMTDTDFGYYGLLKSLYEIKTFNYSTAGEILNNLIEFKFLDDDCEIICYEALEEMYFNVNTPEYLSILMKTIKLEHNNLKATKAEELYFREALYYYINDKRKQFEKKFEKNFSLRYHNTLALLRKIKYDESTVIDASSIDQNTFITPFYFVLYLYKFDNQRFKDTVNYLDYSLYNDIEILAIQIFKLICMVDTNYEKEASSLLQTSYALGNTYLIRLTSSLLVDYLRSKSRYKRCVDIIYKTNNIIKGLNALC